MRPVTNKTVSSLTKELKTEVKKLDFSIIDITHILAILCQMLERTVPCLVFLRGKSRSVRKGKFLTNNLAADDITTGYAKFDKDVANGSLATMSTKNFTHGEQIILAFPDDCLLKKIYIDIKDGLHIQRENSQWLSTLRSGHEDTDNTHERALKLEKYKIAIKKKFEELAKELAILKKACDDYINLLKHNYFLLRVRYRVELMKALSLWLGVIIPVLQKIGAALIVQFVGFGRSISIKVDIAPAN